MLIIRDKSFFKSPSYPGDAAVGLTIGNFDGMHLGHQALFECLDKELAKSSQKKKVRILLTFSPHPRFVLSGMSREEKRREASLRTISPLREKVFLSELNNFDYYYPLRFNKKFSALSPEDFVREYLVDTLGVSVVVVGYDWAFGKGRSAGVNELKNFGAKYGFSVSVVEPVIISGERISSSLVREALLKGELSRLEHYLGRPYALSGRVVKGEGRGQKIGFPTANLHLAPQVLPINGVYFVRVSVGAESYYALANVGNRPTFGDGRRVVEVYIMDGRDLNLYGKQLRVQFIKFLRPEKKFLGIAELQAAIAEDIKTARAICLEEK